jgi:condensin complex subunit 3
MISQETLPEDLIPRCLDVLSKIANGERDLIRVVVDVVTELRAGEGEEDDGVCGLITGLSENVVSADRA